MPFLLYMIAIIVIYALMLLLTYSIRMYREELIAFQEEFCKNDNNPLQLLEIEELKSQVNTVIDSLSVKCRLVFEKYLYEGMSPQEIADEQAISVNTVRVHIKNAMDHIKLQLGPTAGILFLFLYGRL